MFIQHIAISGELGSGKSTLVQGLKARMQLDIVSTGTVQRQAADELGLSTLDLNRLAETDATIDQYIDGFLKKSANSEVPLIFDSRMAWLFVPGSFKIHLIVDPKVAAKRLFSRPRANAEEYASENDAKNLASQRYSSEAARFRRVYGVDVTRLMNYDLVIDTSDALPDEVLDHTVAALTGESTVGGKSILVSPRRVLPTVDPVRDLAHAGDNPHWDEPVVGYSRPHFFCIRGHDALSAEIMSGANLARAFLEVENDDEILPGISANEYLEYEAKLSWIYDWENIHDFRFDTYPERDAH